MVKVIKPERFRSGAMRRELARALQQTGKAIKVDFDSTTATWKRKVDFDTTEKLGAGEPVMSVRVDTGNEVYAYVNDGTRPHVIQAGIYTGKSDKRALAFPSSFKPKTTPGRIGSGPGSSSGPTLFAPMVHHPGTEARKFDEAIVKERRPWFEKKVEQAMKSAARASGHDL